MNKSIRFKHIHLLPLRSDSASRYKKRGYNRDLVVTFMIEKEGSNISYSYSYFDSHFANQRFLYRYSKSYANLTTINNPINGSPISIQSNEATSEGIFLNVFEDYYFNHLMKDEDDILYWSMKSFPVHLVLPLVGAYKDTMQKYEWRKHKALCEFDTEREMNYLADKWMKASTKLAIKTLWGRKYQ